MTKGDAEREDDAVVLARLKEAAAERRRLFVEGKMELIDDPRFDGPIGMDDNGNLFPRPERGDRDGAAADEEPPPAEPG